MVTHQRMIGTSSDHTDAILMLQQIPALLASQNYILPVVQIWSYRRY